ncbi:hypothetical protein [Archangium lansingense]|uniref:Uncharacterized protein n=1 Tax=Archangium lansingense TaxID=2995310 RepID=A0ABT4AE64_9BACT|nr:hypothetical protein [Archangium lansinium]MCY1079504.1 hypothetical protein [Archangium lansinium]
MPSYITAYAILPEPTKADQVLADFKRWRELSGVSCLEECNVIFNDSGDIEREPELVSSEEDGLNRLFEWPTLGGMGFSLSGHKIFVSFRGETPHHVDVITMSMNSKLYVFHPDIRRSFEETVARLHQIFKSKRTVVDYDLLSPASWLKKEVEKVRSGVFEGRYALDLR